MKQYFKFTYINIYTTWLLYFFILLFISFFFRDIHGQYEIYYTIDEIIRSSKLGDPVSFLTGAIDVSKNGWFSPENQWLINLWPPGFMLLEGLIIKLFGNDVYIIFVLQILASLLFSFVLIVIYDLFDNTNKIFAFFIPLILFIFPVSRVFLLEPDGILLGETFSIGFFLLFLLFMLKSHFSKSIFYSILSGLFLGISAYFRSQFETILIIISLCGILYILYNILKYKFFSEDKKIKTHLAKIFLYIIIFSHVVTIPWRIYHYINNDRISWVSGTSLTYSNLVRSSETLESIGAKWIFEGKGNMICLVEPSFCGDIEKSDSKLLIKTFLNNPILWYSLKFEVIDDYWFAELGDWTSLKKESTLINIFINIIILCMFLFIIFSLFKNRIKDISKLIIWILSSVFFCYLMIFTVIHFEARYFYFLKILIIFLFILCLNFYFRKEKYE